MSAVIPRSLIYTSLVEKLKGTEVDVVLDSRTILFYILFIYFNLVFNLLKAFSKSELIFKWRINTKFKTREINVTLNPRFQEKTLIKTKEQETKRSGM